jgi:hypothetical protein
LFSLDRCCTLPGPSTNLLLSGRWPKPQVHHSPIQFLPIRHPQHPCSVQTTQITAQLIGGRPCKLGVGRLFAHQYGFVLDQVLGHPVTEIGQNGVADEVKSSQGEILFNLFSGDRVFTRLRVAQLLLEVIVTITKRKFYFDDNSRTIPCIE